MRRSLLALGLVGCLMASLPAKAVQPDEILPDPSQETRARALSADLRCLVCQNQSIDDSNAPLARDLRRIVRERIQAGDSDRQVRAFLVARYGDFVLLKPPFDARTWLLWTTPFVVFLVGIGGLIAAARTRRRDEIGPAPLTAEEMRALAELSGDTAGEGCTKPAA